MLLIPFTYDVSWLDEKMLVPLNFVIAFARCVDDLGVLFEAARFNLNKRRAVALS